MSKTIDEKVVEMRFDNQNFEKNVSTSLSTLDKLKQSLKFEGAEKGFDSINQAIHNIQLQGISEGVEAIRNQFTLLGTIGRKVIDELADSILGLSTKFTSFITSGVVRGGINRAFNLENANFQLQGLIGSEIKDLTFSKHRTSIIFLKSGLMITMVRTITIGARSEN